MNIACQHIHGPKGSGLSSGQCDVGVVVILLQPKQIKYIYVQLMYKSEG